jgi:hypothetical protein
LHLRMEKKQRHVFNGGEKGKVQNNRLHEEIDEGIGQQRYFF